MSSLEWRRFALMALAMGIITVPCTITAASQSSAQASSLDTLASGAIRSAASYAVPEIKLVRADGKTVSLPEELDDGRPVVMSFIFTTCTTICPLSSQTFQNLQSLLGKDKSRVHMVSVSIDPEQDTPSRLSAYAKKYKAGPNWSFYTGTVQASLTAQRAFGAYRGDKMDHTPLTLFRAAPGKPWVRIDGFATAEELYQVIIQEIGPGAR
jgi:protein SCO1